MIELFACLTCGEIEFGEAGELYCPSCKQPLLDEIQRLKTIEERRLIYNFRRRTFRSLEKAFRGTQYEADINDAVENAVKDQRVVWNEGERK